MTQHKNIWPCVLDHLRHKIGEAMTDKWFGMLGLIDFKEDKVFLSVPDGFHRDWIEDHYAAELRESVSLALGYPAQVAYLVQRQNDPEDNTPPASPQPGPKEPRINGLNPDYTFETFVPGPGNHLAYQTLKAVAEQRAKNLNPVFIYSPIGMGKTHLLHAVGNHIKKNKKNNRILCTQAETFVNDLMQSLKNSTMPEFREKYRKKFDVLLLDDVSFLSGKKQTQEEFYHMFNDLYTSGKKIILASNLLPKDMEDLDERLKSRFESGVIADIKPPDFETRLEIIKTKSLHHKVPLSDDVILYLAENLNGCVRTLEGVMIRLGAILSFTGTQIDRQIAEETLKALGCVNDKVISDEEVVKAVCNYFKIKVSDIRSKKRNRKYALPRQIAMYLLRESLNFSFNDIGNCFGGKDHATAMYACKKVRESLKDDHELKQHVEKIKNSLSL